MKTKWFVCLAVTWLLSCKQPADLPAGLTVEQVMDDVVTRLYQEMPEDQYDRIDKDFMMKFLTDNEKEVLATRYLQFTVNVPVTVSLMLDTEQEETPFWLAEAGFKKTVRVVKNAEYEYEVWEQKYGPGNVGLGINGYKKHRPVYFICVGPQHKGDELKITGVTPPFPLDTMRVGAFTYHDWPGLALTEVPQELTGQALFTTVRGRAREAHVDGAFRETVFPSSADPDQVMLTWSGSPHTSVDIQWRTNTTVPDGLVRYWQQGSSDTLTAIASRLALQDRMLFNDRYIHRFTARVTGLKPGSDYAYQVGSEEKNIWSAVSSFETEKENTDKFSFIWFGDTHCFPDSGRLVSLADRQNGDAAFYSIAGDVVSTGLHRDDWDRLFGYAGTTFSRKPLMPVPGNHDRQDGLGAQMYYDLFSLPENGPAGVEKEASYAFEYGNALFLMIDATSDVDSHTAWIEEQLANTKATWKFAMFHFPPYNFEEPYFDIQHAWVPLFDRYHVDVVMGGHIHYYMRSQPMFNGNVVDAYDKGTVYAISISIPSKHEGMTSEPYAVQQYSEGYFYQRMDIDRNVLKYKAVDSQGIVKDEFVIRKQ